MTRLSRSFTWAIAALIGATVAFGQTVSQSATATATLTIQKSITLARVQDIAFGTVFGSTGSVHTDNVNWAGWSGTTESGNNLSISVAVPTALTGPSDNVPFSCGTTSGYYSDGTNTLQFSPATGLLKTPNVVNGATLVFRLGFDNTAGGGPTNQCVATTGGHQPGAYSGTITLTVAVL